MFWTCLGGKFFILGTRVTVIFPKNFKIKEEFEDFGKNWVSHEDFTAFLMSAHSCLIKNMGFSFLKNMKRLNHTSHGPFV